MNRKDKDELRAEYIEQRTEEMAQRIVAASYSQDAATRDGVWGMFGQGMPCEHIGDDGDTETNALVALIHEGPDAAREVLMRRARSIALPFAEREADEPPDNEPTACEIAELMEWRAA